MTTKLILYRIILICIPLFTGTWSDDNVNLAPIIKSSVIAEYNAIDLGEIDREEAFEIGKISEKNFNTLGDLLIYVRYENDASNYLKATYEREANGEIRKQTNYDAKGRILGYIINIFDVDGRVVEHKTYNADDEMTYTHLNEYDFWGNNTLTIVSNPPFDKSFKIIKAYNENKQLIEKTIHSHTGKVISVLSFEYDSQGNEILQMENGQRKFISEYDSNNNLELKSVFEKGSEQSQTKYDYIYDEYNNWITKLRYSNLDLDYVWERKIEYYQ